MSRSRFAQIFLGLCLLQGSFLTSACSSEPSSDSEQAATGTFAMPLLAGAGGHTYRLEGAMYVNGPLFTHIDLSGDVVTASLPTGDYDALLYWWTLMRDDGTGNFAPVDATMVSTNAPRFTIFNQAMTTLTFQFQTDGQLVTVGSGSLTVTVGVDETEPLCTPLGVDCPDAGTWCAPSELTGMRLACIAEGPVPLGGACLSPLDCAANASCFDFGSGATCHALCARADFDQPCSSGGICTRQGGDYGVCAPTP